MAASFARTGYPSLNADWSWLSTDASGEPSSCSVSNAVVAVNGLDDVLVSRLSSDYSFPPLGASSTLRHG